MMTYKILFSALKRTNSLSSQGNCLSSTTNIKKKINTTIHEKIVLKQKTQNELMTQIELAYPVFIIITKIFMSCSVQ